MSQDRKEQQEQQEHYKELLCEILNTLEGGDVSLDFEDMPSAATTIRIIADIAGRALRGIITSEEILEKLNKTFDEDAPEVSK
jgi:hypothetical protein